MTADFDPTPYLQLAPTRLPNRRDARYDGGGFGISLNELAPEDVALVLRTYQTVKGIYDLWLYMRSQPNYGLLRQQLQPLAGTEFLTTAQAIGMATYASRQPGPALRRAVHDLRGGGLTALAGYASLISRLPDSDEVVRQAVYLARDHAKMMRNLIPDLDRPVRQADESSKLHHISEFVSKWRAFRFDISQKQVRVAARSTYDGYITSRCLETSAVDRILYNYINNGARFAAAGQVQLTVLPVSQTVTRWVVENEIGASQRDWLLANLGQDLSRLFQGGYTRGGHGIGLASCTDIVAAGFGVEPGEAIALGYLGARVIDQTYYGWFHWPAYQRRHDAEPECDCHE